MTQPQQLPAQAALDSLRRSMRRLDQRIERERYGWTVVDDGLRSWAPSTGRSSLGGHGDPIGTAIASSVSYRAARRKRWTLETLVWLAARLCLDGPPLDALEAVIPRLRPSTAEQLRLWLNELDERVRATLDRPEENSLHG